VLEHFGLGPYSDPVGAAGFQRGLAHLAALLQPRGTLYLATPVGRERVEFSDNWVFATKTILALAASHGLPLQRFLVFNYYPGLAEIGLESPASELERLAQAPYQWEIMQFVKKG